MLLLVRDLTLVTRNGHLQNLTFLTYVVLVSAPKINVVDYERNVKNTSITS